MRRVRVTRAREAWFVGYSTTEGVHTLPRQSVELSGSGLTWPITGVSIPLDAAGLIQAFA